MSISRYGGGGGSGLPSTEGKSHTDLMMLDLEGVPQWTPIEDVADAMAENEEAVAALQNALDSAVDADSIDAALTKDPDASNLRLGAGALAEVVAGLNVTLNEQGGFNNTAIGIGAAPVLTTGRKNTFLGYQAGYNATEAWSNTIIGVHAAADLTTGGGNTVVGYQGLETNETGNHNTSIGRFTLYYAEGSFNTAVGAGALSQVTTGERNTMLGTVNETDLEGNGYPAVVEGNDNVFLGYNSGPSSVDTDNAIAIGSGVDVSASNRAVIGNADCEDVFLGSETPAATLHCNGVVFPTSDPMKAGAWWNNAGTLTISAAT